MLYPFLFAQQVRAEESKKVNIYLFWGEGCPHCASEKVFLEDFAKENSNVKFYDYEVWKSEENRNLLIKVGDKLGVSVSGVPFLVVGDKYFVGFYSEETTGKAIKETVYYASVYGCRDIIAEILNSVDTQNEDEQCPSESTQSANIPEKITLPLIGDFSIKNLSLPVLTIILGILDGFNPCAMWVLLFLISLLLGMQDKKRRWILGTAFIIASASVYFVFMAAWLNLLLFIGFIVWVRIIIGLIALAGGGYNLREFVVNKDGSCKVTGSEKRKKVFEQLKEITHQKQFILAFLGIILLAFVVNLVELVCSAGLPVVFTQILTLSKVSSWQYYAYMFLYIFFFMIDDLFVFFTAMITMEMTGISGKYSRFSHLIGGFLMIIIGLLLIFKPELLMFS
ncbi:hypothetical protein A2X44_04695 [candidate division CPR3 bacterium GWF2_35_18]|nr:MAG: hypothetical protein A2X44_04695 [candidate division CPR3 bacterium GWF2_35_18]OGB64193.1 MAG: hypothetical protein A2250_02550 [candidate division CPR3 bacterium RIFOXYA2_FULL_35_13]OGB78396.1 MAG: hypothetical protein A2296_02745 [candidate division CPR3 bacterium RIFOXYB2_FULL_35_8]OGB80245.1 MAG: hypothetical protein A2011_01250 [candidate division CPR3 bacterium GWE2_35_7]